MTRTDEAQASKFAYHVTNAEQGYCEKASFLSPAIRWYVKYYEISTVRLVVNSRNISVDLFSAQQSCSPFRIPMRTSVVSSAWLTGSLDTFAFLLLGTDASVPLRLPSTLPSSAQASSFWDRYLAFAYDVQIQSQRSNVQKNHQVYQYTRSNLVSAWW